jgi:hypothetical protein
MPNETTAAETPPAEPGENKVGRIDFLKQVIAFSEHNIRSYDIKAQISLAAFVLSGNPLIGIINAACGTSARHVLVISLLVFVATILSYLWVLWPVVPPDKELTDGLASKDLFYLYDPLSVGATYLERLQGLVLEPELTAEALKLAFIRSVKARRFKNALIVTLIAYLVVLAAFFTFARCVF